ncbi:hypothetical protein RHSIM_Rhsim03G0140900 [Rhododendron simsii]|uniref:Uncharacterized protein n=1 Tax=Rhododendron simsii TaxID=118357 RepID=A0A834H696_RHOSS|nr:hypothetical protein RHSIM_Rhsim03G0140900 [Rhododendron simsii]
MFCWPKALIDGVELISALGPEDLLTGFGVAEEELDRNPISRVSKPTKTQIYIFTPLISEERLKRYLAQQGNNTMEEKDRQNATDSPKVDSAEKEINNLKKQKKHTRTAKCQCLGKFGKAKTKVVKLTQKLKIVTESKIKATEVVQNKLKEANGDNPGELDKATAADAKARDEIKVLSRRKKKLAADVAQAEAVEASEHEEALKMSVKTRKFMDRLFGSESSRAFNLVDRSIPAIGTENLNLEIKGFEDQFGSDSSVGLSMWHTIEHPSSCLSCDGIRKVKVNEVRDSDNDKPISMGSCYSRGDNINISIRVKRSTKQIAVSCLWVRIMTMEMRNVEAMSQPFDKRNGDFIQMGHQYEGKWEGPFYNKEPENYIPICTSVVWRRSATTYNKGNSSIQSMGQNYNKGWEAGSSTISFGDFEDEAGTNPYGGIISGYGLLTSQASSLTLNPPGMDDSVEHNNGFVSSGAPAVTSKSNATPKIKKPKLYPQECSS